MKKIIFLSITAAIAVGLAACGDNKTKKKLIGTQVITSSSSGAGNLSTKDGLSSAVLRGANVSSMATGSIGAGGLAPLYNGAISRVPSGEGLSGPDGEGYYSISGYSFSNTTVKIRFQDAAGNALTLGPGMASLAKLHVKITTAYAFGTFNGDFLILNAGLTATSETMESGTITTSDPVGGTFTATITNMVVERTTINGIPFGLPVSGSMDISGSAGGFSYSGSNTYSKSGSSYKCEGPINVSGAKVADVYLTFNTTAGNYTGYWVDAATGEQHTIQ
jgi:hypothetical protein